MSQSKASTDPVADTDQRSLSDIAQEVDHHYPKAIREMMGHDFSGQSAYYYLDRGLDAWGRRTT